MVRRQNFKNRSNYPQQTGATDKGFRPFRDEKVVSEGKYSNKDQSSQKDRGSVKGAWRDGNERGTGGGYSQKSYIYGKAEETTDDIKNDIKRIEKEIELEIKEIKSVRLGL